MQRVDLSSSSTTRVPAGVLQFLFFFFFFNDTATTEIYTLSLHDALPIFANVSGRKDAVLATQTARAPAVIGDRDDGSEIDRKSTRLNSSHTVISYAVFCLKKKKNNGEHRNQQRGSSLQTVWAPTNKHERY